ncbi:ferrochelatase [Actinobaculum sp. 352]|uniref:ferrochelatase n=1 Tax=Actinobaculum sp. 352 TaxID=2490946 RepID=UPI000F7EA273|nr:ferrochelatase [Actinobaculum sp. 352]RTE49242.1 ferrochelatase [Actinobaculum sp. 352]
MQEQAVPPVPKDHGTPKAHLAASPSSPSQPLLASSGAAKEGVLIAALGSPTHLSPEAIADFLREFLSDRRVVDLHPALWKPILHGPVLHARPTKVLPQYQHVWLTDGSPLRVYTAAQESELQRLLPGVEVRAGYQYGAPNMVDQFLRLAATCDRITVLATYPQYAPATVGSVDDRIADGIRHAAQAGLFPRVRSTHEWHLLPEYITWYSRRIGAALAEGPIDEVVFSWHSLPDRPVHEPDFYRAQCEATAAAIMERVQLDSDARLPWRNTFQSRFGPGRWMTPATIDTMAELPAQGSRHIVMVTPGFFADCLETSYELDVLNAQAFHAAGGQGFRRIAPPNGSADAAQILAALHRSLPDFSEFAQLPEATIPTR